MEGTLDNNYWMRATPEISNPNKIICSTTTAIRSLVKSLNPAVCPSRYRSLFLPMATIRIDEQPGEAAKRALEVLAKVKPTHSRHKALCAMLLHMQALRDQLTFPSGVIASAWRPLIFQNSQDTKHEVAEIEVVTLLIDGLRDLNANDLS